MLIPLLAATAVLLSPADSVRTAPGVEYRIEAVLNESTAVLEGRGRLRYTHRAGAPLDTLWFHQHLNAFRPNSAWAQRELEFGVTRFQELPPEEHAFERLHQVHIDGMAVTPVYPGAPDSTVVGFPLPASLAPGATAVVDFDWSARLSTTPRRQGRRGRHYDFAQWYPRIAARQGEEWQVQPLLPQGEFFGEFASYDITLDLAADQVVGATGVPVEGDPGWLAAAAPTSAAPLLASDAYPVGEAESLGLLGAEPGPERKRIRWRAEEVHHFAWSADPDFVYEGGDLPRADGANGGRIALHVLYWPEDRDWRGVALERTATALRWLQERFGPYPWPQLTNLHRLEPGGTEFPMLVMNGSPSEGLIMHEVSHQYLHGILANNEFREGWLDEGFVSFLTDWYFEEHGVPDVWGPSMQGIVQMERLGETAPIGTPGAEFENPSIYSAMTYTKASLVLRMLRWLIGEEAFEVALRSYFQEHALGHVTEADFRRAIARAAGEELDWFFDQWIHTTAQLDYAITAATTRQLPSGEWQTQVEITREGEAWMPVELRIGELSRRLSWQGRRQSVEVVTEERPTEAVLDPEGVLIDYERANNRRVVVE